MNKATFMKIQQTLTAVALVSIFVAIAFAVETYNLIQENDLDELGYQILPTIVGVSIAVSVLATLSKIVAYARR